MILSNSNKINVTFCSKRKSYNFQKARLHHSFMFIDILQKISLNQTKNTFVFTQIAKTSIAEEQIIAYQEPSFAKEVDELFFFY